MSRSEIDDIFAAKKRKPSHPTRPRHPAEAIPDPSKKQAPRKRDADAARFKDSRGSASRRKTADGYTIYREDELGISTTGGGGYSIQSLLALLPIRLAQTPPFARLTANAVFERFPDFIRAQLYPLYRPMFELPRHFARRSKPRKLSALSKPR